MTLADVPAVAALEQVAFTLPWSAHAFEYEVRNNPMAHFFVLRPREFNASVVGADGQMAAGRLGMQLSRPVLGYGGLWLIVDEGHICTLAVHPAWRGRGLGELLLVGLLECAIALNATVATLEVRASNVVAQNLYRKYGFVRVGLRKGYYADNNEDAVIMTTDLITSTVYRRRLHTLKAALLQRLALQC
jgi:ribosomal-protein-alanine N-acetyltransferase